MIWRESRTAQPFVISYYKTLHVCLRKTNGDCTSALKPFAENIQISEPRISFERDSEKQLHLLLNACRGIQEVTIMNQKLQKCS